MDVKEAIEVINHAVYVDGEIVGANEEEAWVTIKNELERTRWIPVSERLPTEKDSNINGLVHVWLKDGNCDYEDWQDVARYAVRYQRVTHWMPLPKPPEVE